MNWVNGMRIWRAVRGEGSELGSSSRARGTPLAQGEGSELGIGPDPKAPQRMLIVGQQPNRLRDPPKNAWFRADGMLDNACKDAAAS